MRPWHDLSSLGHPRTRPKTLVGNVMVQARLSRGEKTGHQGAGLEKRLSSEIAGQAEAWTIRSRTRTVVTGRVIIIR